MTSRLEQFYPAPASPRDETAERLFWGAQEYGKLQTYNLSEENEKKSLANIVDSLRPERRENFYRQIEAFEKRARSDNLTKDQIESTYRQVRRLIENPSVSLTEDQRLNIAEQVISMAADPTSVDQGVHDTCGAAVVEARTYLRHPEMASRLVVDVALTAQVLTKSGMALPIDLEPHDTSKLAMPRSGQRCHASEIFQVAAINLVLNDRPGTSEGTVVYRQRDRRPETIDTGERVVDYSTSPPRERKFAGLYVDDLLRMNNLITGENEPELVFWRPAAKSDNQIGKTFSTESEMEAALLEAKKDGKLPAILYVYSGSEPLWQDAPNNADGGRGAWHYINVIDIRPGTPAMVEIDSTWGKRADHTRDSGAPIKLADLYLSALNPNEAESQLRKQVAADTAAGTVDTSRQVALARQEWVNGKIDTNGLEQSFRELLLFADARWKNEQATGKLDQDEQRRSLTKVMEAVDRMPYENKLRMLESLRSRGIIDFKEFNSAVVSTANEMSEQRMMLMFAGELDPATSLAFKLAQDELNKRLTDMTPETRRVVDEQLKRGQNNDYSGFFAVRAKERRDRRKL